MNENPEGGSYHEYRNLHHHHDEFLTPVPQYQVENGIDGGDKNVMYQVMYAHSQHSDASYTRPVTPLQITIPDGDASPTVPVSCGNAVGKMHLNLFMCPGIHQPCIEVGNDLLSPKQFTIRGDKERQKDWKASIRVGKSSLRTHMEGSTIDFYDHPNRCSGKCQSRNYVNYTPEDPNQERKKVKRTSDTNYLKNEIENEIAGRGENPDDKKTKILNYENSEKPKAQAAKTTGKKTRGRPRGSVNKPKEIKMEVQDDRFFDEFFTDNQPNEEGSSDGHHRQYPREDDRNGQPVECSPFSDILNCLQNEPLNFWSQMQDTGVISHFCDDIIVSAVNLKQSAIEQNINQNTANMLTRTAYALGIHPVMVQRVQSIERNVYQQRKHEEMFVEIQQKLAEEHREKSMVMEQATPSEVVVVEQEDVRTAIEAPEEEFIDVVSEKPGPSNVS